MRVSTTLAVLAWLGSWGYAQEPRSRVSSRPLPEKFLHWPFSPGEDWRITNSYDRNGHGNNIPYALDFQRAGSSRDAARQLTQYSVVRAAAPGKVIAAVTTDRGGYGKYVVIDHGNGFATLYGHLSEVSIRPGMEVPALEKLGVAGNTGASTGAHLHFEVRDIQGARRWQDGKFVKPEPIMGQRDFSGATPGRPLPRTPDGKTGSYSYALNDLDPSVQNVAADVAEQLKKAFGTEQPRRAPRSDVASRPPPAPPQPTPPRPSPGVSQPSRDGRRVEPPQPTPPRPEFPAQPPLQRGDDASKRTVATLGPFRFVIPKGWGIAEQHSDGMGITMGPDGKNNWPRYITFLQHPGLGRGPHTPEGINRAIQQNTRRQGATTAVRVGKKEHRGVWFSGSDGGGYVLFSPGGSVYMLGYGSSVDKGMLQEILRSIEPKP